MSTTVQATLGQSGLTVTASIYSPGRTSLLAYGLSAVESPVGSGVYVIDYGSILSHFGLAYGEYAVDFLKSGISLVLASEMVAWPPRVDAWGRPAIADGSDVSLVETQAGFVGTLASATFQGTPGNGGAPDSYGSLQIQYTPSGATFTINASDSQDDIQATLDENYLAWTVNGSPADDAFTFYDNVGESFGGANPFAVQNNYFDNDWGGINLQTSFADGAPAIAQQFTLTLTSATAGAWLLKSTSNGLPAEIAGSATSSQIGDAFTAQGWPLASVVYASGDGDGAPNATYAVSWTVGTLTGIPQVDIGTLQHPSAAPGDQMDIVATPNSAALFAIAGAIWNSLVAAFSAVGDSFGWLFATKILPLSGQIAAQSDVKTLQNNTAISLSIPPAIQLPSAGSIAYPVAIYLRDSAGVMTNATATPTITVVDTSGASYASRLSAVTNPETGKYTFTATIESGDYEMLLIWEVTAVLAEGTQIVGGQSWVTQEVAAYFTTDDRSTLQSLAAQVGVAGAGLTALPPVALTEATHAAIAADTQAGLSNQGFTTTRAGYLDTLSGLVAAVWSAATSSLGGGIGQRLFEFIGAGAYTAPPTPQTIAAAVLQNSANPLATDALGRVTPAPVFWGTGSIAWPLTIQLANGEPLGNAEVWVSTDEAGDTIVAGPAATDSTGRVIFSLAPGAFYRWAAAAGCTFENPQSFTVSES